jgi:hypothetical protein
MSFGAATSNAAVVKRVPSAPVLQSIVAGDKTFTITISAPLDPGTAPVTQYAYSLNGSSWSGLGLASIADKPKLIMVPTNDIDYHVRVRAGSSAGWGEVLDAGIVHPLPVPPVYPDAPVIVSASDIGCHILRVEFQAPVVPFGKITRYQYQLGDGYAWNNGVVKAGVVLIHTAVKRPFTFRISAFNSDKKSGWGATAESVVQNTYPKCPYDR